MSFRLTAFRDALVTAICALVLAMPADAAPTDAGPAPSRLPGYLGVLARDTSDGGGAVLAEVVGGSPSEESGLRPGDVVVAVEGQAVQTAGEMIAALTPFGPGQSVTFTVQRDGFTHELAVRLGDRPAVPQRQFPDFGRVRQVLQPLAGEWQPRPDTLLEDRTALELRLGLHVQPANSAALVRRGLPNRAGVMVSRVERDSPADLAGIKIGALVVSVDGMPVDSRQALTKLLAAAGESTDWTFFVGSEERSGTLTRRE